MQRKFGILAAAALAVVAFGIGPQITGSALAQNNCEFGERIDGTSAADAARKFAAAGFTSVRGLKKGCDNFWHGIALRNGVEIGVVLSPEGTVMQETN